MFIQLTIEQIMTIIFILNKGILGYEIVNFTEKSETCKNKHKCSVSTNIPLKVITNQKLDSVSEEKINNIFSKNLFLELSRLTSNNLFKSSADKVVSNITSHRQHVTLAHPDSLHPMSLQPNFQPSTPSYIEFHYLDNFDHNINRQNNSAVSNNNNVRPESKDSISYKIAFLRPPYLLLRLNDEPDYKQHSTRLPSSSVINSIIDNINYDKDNYYKLPNESKSFPVSSNDRSNFRSFLSGSTNKNKKNVYKKISLHLNKTEDFSSLYQDKNEIKSRTNPIVAKKPAQKLETTTVYDRIKFFEIYDNDTESPPSLLLRQEVSLDESHFDQERISLINTNNDKIYEVHANPGNQNNYNFARYIKQEAILNYTDIEELGSTERKIPIKANNIQNLTNVQISSMLSYRSYPASWSDVPFAAVYLYEPTQVRCDSASISSHWLVASATCLYRHHKDLRPLGRSAFVAYCGSNWRFPERIAYVRRSLLHPRFKPTDKIRRQLYNIGVIEVTNSMSNTCDGWQPVSLMSHQFIAHRSGTLATAIGWGLDRYDNSYTISEYLHNLMLYEGLLYSDSCPGNSDYIKTKHLNEDSVKNIYCLSLPAYTTEEKDPVHGSLLLVGGKLIALFLQEERRSWGEQSAQYTGIWRLIPWILDVAQEIDDKDPLDTDI